MNDSPWIGVIEPEDWSSKEQLQNILEKVTDRDNGQVDNIMAIHSLNPNGLEAHHSLYISAMSGTSTLRKVERELLAFVVSIENQCHY